MNQQPRQQQMQGSLTMHFGTITEVNLAAASARVLFPDMQQFESYFLPVLQHRTGSTSNSYWMPNVGENVVALLDANGEQGVIMGGVYNQSSPSGVSAANQLDIVTAVTTIASDVIITGDVQILGNVQTTGNTATQGAVTVTGSHSINGKDTIVLGGVDNAGHIAVTSGQ